ncbi:feruloyl esterase [Variovorax sp. 770b2]|nr:feruloyl esterase [Variovorax sp. 770b2]
MWATSVGNERNPLHFLFQDTTVTNYLARDPEQDLPAYAYESNLAALHGLPALNDATNTDLRHSSAAAPG